MKLFARITSVIGIISIIIVILMFSIKVILPPSEFGNNDIIKRSDSPDGTLTAIAFIRNCGATTPFSTQVSIIYKSDKFTNNDTGNVFICEHSEKVDIEWKNNSCLIIYYSGSDADILEQVIKNNNTTIEYIKKY